MEVLAFQLLVFALILISSLFGRKVRNGFAIIVTVFTIFAVFMSWLMILQLITIIISVVISESIIVGRENREEDRKQHQVQSSSSGSKVFIAFLVISALLYSFYLNTSKDDNSNVDEYTKETINDVDSSFYQNNVEYTTTEPVFDDNSIIDTTRENAISDYRESDYIEDIDYDDSKSIYGKWHYANSSREIESGSLLIEKFGVENFNFRLRVFNDYATGDISGTAKFITENIAVFQSDRCESLLFDFRTIGDVTISEVNCIDYHGRDISFNSIFEK